MPLTQWVPGSFLPVKRGRCVTLTSHPHHVSRSEMSRSYTSSHPWRLHWGSETGMSLPRGKSMTKKAATFSGFSCVQCHDLMHQT
jgi:hypothetical protein